MRPGTAGPGTVSTSRGLRTTVPVQGQSSTSGAAATSAAANVRRTAAPLVAGGAARRMTIVAISNAGNAMRYSSGANAVAAVNSNAAEPTCRQPS